jgi:acetaldehyde dehydrogenase/alcohol dehydrogenase
MIDEVMRFNAAEVPTKMGTFPQYSHPHTLARYAEVADYLGIGGANDAEKLENLIRAIDELKVKIGIKPTIRDYVPDEKDFLAKLDTMTEQAFDDQCTGANPRYPLMSEIKQMYLNAYYGKKFTEEAKPGQTVPARRGRKPAVQAAKAETAAQEVKQAPAKRGRKPAAGKAAAPAKRGRKPGSTAKNNRK